MLQPSWAGMPTSTRQGLACIPQTLLLAPMGRGRRPGALSLRVAQMHTPVSPLPKHGTLCPLQPEDASGGSSPSGTSKSDANRASSGGGGGGLMEEMNKLLAKR